jgi:hypothetical protein
VKAAPAPADTTDALSRATCALLELLAELVVDEATAES